MQGIREGRAVHAHLALADEAELALVHELDRVLDREDVAFLAALIASMTAASVVDLPEPVLPVTRISRASPG